MQWPSFARLDRRTAVLTRVVIEADELLLLHGKPPSQMCGSR
jgi:hypothetical protein